MNHTISISHYSLIKSFLIFFLNFLDVNICAKNISFTEFFSILNVQTYYNSVVTIYNNLLDKPLKLTCLYQQVFFMITYFCVPRSHFQVFSPFYNHIQIPTINDNHKLLGFKLFTYNYAILLSQYTKHILLVTIKVLQMSFLLIDIIQLLGPAAGSRSL